ncbi:hypothetical protein C471_09980 [Halorubrum saccharovorum DSM 1137]|uniref:Uncharacterized protein n=1 Tax=Halorubrum saccharovorum DSM 1137 TaxID=1227484 RepID=M0DS04_9EURY|nr:hypothetical protein C471_09980 [Halorubrum saccharovorum DSM 1137]
MPLSQCDIDWDPVVAPDIAGIEFVFDGRDFDRKIVSSDFTRSP